MARTTQADIRNQDAPPQASWGGRRNALLSPVEEEAFLSPWVAQAEYKKKLPETVATACEKNIDRLPVRLMFQDEARFGRMSDPRK